MEGTPAHLQQRNFASWVSAIRPCIKCAVMSVIYSEEELNTSETVVISNDYPVVISKFIMGAKEIEVDAVADKGVLKSAISEHEDVVFMGDATLILPQRTSTARTHLLNTQKIATKSYLVINIQYIA